MGVVGTRPQSAEDEEVEAEAACRAHIGGGATSELTRRATAHEQNFNLRMVSV
jgi:hypothetical protein